MKKIEEFKFRIEAFSPSSIPMSRLAEYMTELANLFGYHSSVHFVRLEEGSTVIVPAVEYEDVPKVRERLTAVHMHEGPTDAMRAFSQIDRKLSQDNASGVLVNENGCEVIQFPGRNRPKPVTYGPIKQQGSLDGVLIKIGGKDSTVPTAIMNEKVIYNCNTSRSVARNLAPHIFGPVLRVHGNGKWHRDENGEWVMDKFDITDFEILRDSSLSEIISRLRDIDGNEWRGIVDPLSDLHGIRHGSDEVH